MKREKLSLEQCEVLVGILLGDGSLQTESKGKTYRLRVCQSEEHKDYLFHLYSLFENLTSSAPIRHVYPDSRNPKKVRVSWSFATRQQVCFRFYGQQFYGPEGTSGGKKKKLPQSIHRLLKPRSIAYWYMDDGAQKWKGRSKGIRFCTDNFSHSECKLLAELLKKKIPIEN